MTRRRGTRTLVVVITVVMVLLLAEGVLVGYVFISPSAGDRLGGVAAAVQRLWEGDRKAPGIRTRVADAAKDAYRGVIEPLWRQPAVPSGDPEFAACVGCHRDYASTTKFDVYMDHPLHAQLGVACSTCHLQNEHPGPAPPPEKACAQCHDVNDRSACSVCHPPASLPHFYLLGASKDAVVNCDVCHPKASFTQTHPTPKVVVATMGGSDRSVCLACHQQAACRRCHAEPHPSNWVAIHGQNLFGGNATACYTCHVAAWCSDRCHSVTSTVPSGTRPVPRVGVRP